VSCIVLFIWYENTKSWREAIELFIFNFPLVGKIYRNYILSNIASTLSTLVGSGISIIKALNLVWKSSNSIVYENIFEDVIARVSKWEWIVKSMEEVDKKHDFFPYDYTQMLSVWEKTASLESISKKISVQYEKEVDYSLARLTKWIEPMAILLAWIFVCWFAFAIFGAILKVTDAVG
jgi:type II secretory pathway component PulF